MRTIVQAGLIFLLSILLVGCMQQQPKIITYGPDLQKTSRCGDIVPRSPSLNFGYYCKCEIMGVGDCIWKLHQFGQDGNFVPFKRYGSTNPRARALFSINSKIA
jgi:hypothetical protein